MHTNLGPGFEYLDEERLKVDTKVLDELTAFRLGTAKGNVITLIFLDPKQGIVTFQDTESLPEPTLCSLQGATAGGSSVHMGFIEIGLRLRLNLLGGGLVITPTIESIDPYEDKEQIAKIAEKARAEMPREATEEDIEKIRNVILGFVDKTFPENTRQRIKDFIRDFSIPNGQGMILGVLDAAQKVGKLDQAFTVLEKINHEHWMYRPPVLRGEFLTPSDIDAIQRAYRELGLPLPQ